jgi:hypothetical protein
MSQSLLLLYLHTFLVRCFSSGFLIVWFCFFFFFFYLHVSICFRVSGLDFWCFVIFPFFLFLFRIPYDSLFYYPYQAFGGFGVRGVCIVQDVDHLSWFRWKALFWLFCFWEGRLWVLSSTIPNVHYCDFYSPILPSYLFLLPVLLSRAVCCACSCRSTTSKFQIYHVK